MLTIDVEIKRVVSENTQVSKNDQVQEENQDQDSTQYEESEEGSDANSSLGDQPDTSRYSVARDRQQRSRRPPQRYGFSDLVAYALSSASESVRDEPLTYEEALASKESGKWIEAMKSEIASLRKNQTWDLVDKPKGQRIVGCKWLYKIKKGAGDNPKPRYEDRLVVKGFTQV